MSFRRKVGDRYRYKVMAYGHKMESTTTLFLSDFEKPEAAIKEFGMTEQELEDDGVEVDIKANLYAGYPPSRDDPGEGPTAEFDLYYKGKIIKSELTDDKNSDIESSLFKEADDEDQGAYDAEVDRRIDEWKETGRKPSMPRRNRNRW
jgi:hypothetical protein